MKPSTKTFLASAGFVIAAAAVGMLRYRVTTSTGFPLGPVLIGMVVALGIGVAWVRLLLDRRERRRRPKPLNLG